MTRSLEKSNRHYKRAEKQLPLGVSSNWRAWGPEKTIYVERAKGARIEDIDGYEIDDFCLGDTGSMFGHSPAPVAKAIRRQAATTSRQRSGCVRCGWAWQVMAMRSASLMASSKS